MSNMRKLEEQLMRHEGFRSKPYSCSAGKLTIGFGRNLDNVGVSRDESITMLTNDIQTARRDALKLGVNPHTIGEVRFYVIVNMCFNLGGYGVSKFYKMWDAIGKLDFETASKEMLDSRWASQVGNRAKELSEQMRTGEWQ